MTVRIRFGVVTFSVFAATRGGASGVITADHCRDDLTYGGSASAVAFEKASNPFYDFNKMQVFYFDVQFMRAQKGHQVVAKFQSVYGSYKTVKAVKAPVLGETIYRYGVVTGQKKYKVYQVNTCHFHEQPKKTYCGLAVADTANSGLGDSGGPWFVGTTAKGIHSGSIRINGQNRNLFTDITVVTGAVGATIKKG